MSHPTCSKPKAENGQRRVRFAPTDVNLDRLDCTRGLTGTQTPSEAPKFKPTIAAASVLATIQRSNGELEVLREALGRIEDILTEERSRAISVREKAHREAQQNAAQVQTLSQKISEERCKRRMLREELSSAAEHLKSLVEKNSALLSALEISQQENEKAVAVRCKLETELESSRKSALHLKQEVMNLKESLESATIACDSKSSIIGRLQTQVAQARAHASVQTAALATAAACQRQLQTKLSEFESNRYKDLAQMQSDNQILHFRLKETRAELDLARNDTAQKKAEARHDIILMASQRQTMCKRLQEAHNTAASNSARIAELQGQVAALKIECKKAKAETAAALIDRTESANAVQEAIQVFDLLQEKLQAAEARSVAVRADAGRQRVALAVVGRGFEEIAEQLAVSEDLLQSEKESHRGTRAELNAVRNEYKVARRGKS